MLGSRFKSATVFGFENQISSSAIFFSMVCGQMSLLTQLCTFLKFERAGKRGKNDLGSQVICAFITETVIQLHA